MNILFITENHSPKNYGVTTVVSQLADQLVEHDPDISIHILETSCQPVQQDSRISIYSIPPQKWMRFWGWSRELSKTIRQIIVEHHIDLIHVHGVWMAPQWAALLVGKKMGIPCMVSSHGMLESWLWENQSQLQATKKKIYFHLIFKPVLHSKTIFHAITPIEKESLSRQFPGFSVCVIPNAISISDSENTSHHETNKQFVFLGRIHPVKAVDVLINAFHQAKLPPDWQLLIAGPEYSPIYANHLKKITSLLGLEKQILFTGPLYNEQKTELLCCAWAMVTPSYSEVMSMVNLEAATQKLPSITTYETGLWDWEEGGGILIHPDVEQLANALKKTSEWSLSERLERGQRSFDLVNQKYSWQVVIPQWVAFYKSCIENQDSSRFRNK